MRLPALLGFAALFALVQACSTAGSEPGPEEEAGEESPEPEPKADEPAPPAAANPPAEAEERSPDPDPPPAAPPKEKSKMTFFVTSTGSRGGNLGGLAGADKKCQDLATAVNAGDHTWHAYLSAALTNAKDRIGTGPWQNQKGKIIAANLTALHDYLFVPANDDMLDEKGAPIPKKGSRILTGSKQDGTALPQTCQNWTSSNGNNRGHLGDALSATSNILGVRWNDAIKNSSCSQQGLQQNASEGRLYCFAID